MMGCAPTEAPQFTPSADVVALTADAQSADEKQQWSGLQRDIEDELAKRCGTPLMPVGGSDNARSRSLTCSPRLLFWRAWRLSCWV
jgi:hypothetical protein